jgi:hypothetical protein
MKMQLWFWKINIVTSIFGSSKIECEKSNQLQNLEFPKSGECGDNILLAFKFKKMMS